MKSKRETVKGTCYIWAIPLHPDSQKENADPFYYEIGMSHHWRDEAVRVSEIPIVAVVPEGIDLIAKAIETMNESISEIEDEAAAKVAKLNYRIRALALIEHQPEPDND